MAESKAALVLHDDKCQAAISRNQNMLVPWYLMAAHAYYDLDEPIISDALFDELAQRLLKSWDTITHWHKHLITTDDLRAGTLLRRDLPMRIAGAVRNLKGLPI